MSQHSDEQYTVALQGFSEFERNALSTFFRLAAQRTPSYTQVDRLDRSDFVIADADHKASLQSVLAAGRQNDTVFVGARAPQGAMAWLRRPIDPMHIVRELDSLVEQRNSAPGALSAALAEPVVDVPVDVDAPDPMARAAASGLFTHDDLSSGPDVLVVEDSPIARRFLQLRLQNLGYRVHLARNGDEAVELLKRQQFALVFLDIALGPPGSLDGLTICQDLKQRRHGDAAAAAKVVMVTGLGGAMDRVRGTLAGCDAYLTKPLVEEEFLDTLRTLDPMLSLRQAGVGG
ncbi:response regulator [Piscinibacter sp.]|jgi:two-component system cell cycle response regulator|uniref:response regulator n=1 Tax=Piscinibacter sp. TaxID=1903157 RepID=UPI00355A7CBD